MTETSWSGEARYRAILMVAEAANAQLELSALLDAVAVALEGLVPVDAVGVLARDGARREPSGPTSLTPRRSDEPEADLHRPRDRESGPRGRHPRNAGDPGAARARALHRSRRRRAQRDAAAGRAAGPAAGPQRGLAAAHGSRASSRAGCSSCARRSIRSAPTRCAFSRTSPARSAPRWRTRWPTARSATCARSWRRRTSRCRRRSPPPRRRAASSAAPRRCAAFWSASRASRPPTRPCS